MHSALYEFFRDQGSIIGGLLALAAGYLAFTGAMRAAGKQVAAVNAQTEALQDQNSDLNTESRRRRARGAITAIKLLDSVLGIVRADVAKVTKLTVGSTRSAQTWWRQRISGRLFINSPLTLCGALSVSVARRSSIITCCWTQN
jgi:hypothetical protein